MQTTSPLGGKKIRYLLSLIFMTVGVVLLSVACIGTFLPVTIDVLPSMQEWDRIDAKLVQKTRTLVELMAEAKLRTPGFDGAPPEARVRALFEVTAQRFNLTAAPRHYSLTSNWLLYTLGSYRPAISAVLDPDTLLRLGSNGTCDQISYVLLQLALRAGIPARHVGTYGHVVVEVWYGEDWHMYDPHLEVVPLRPDGTVYSVEDLSRDRQAIRKIYADREPYLERSVRSIGDRRDNSFVSYPPGAYFVWKADVLRILHSIAEWAKYVLPLIALFVGWLMHRGSSKPSLQSRSE